LFSRLPAAVAQEPRIWIHLKQARFRVGDIEPPWDECSRDGHGVGTFQKRMRLKRRDTGFHG